MTSWYSPMVSAPMRRERNIRYTKPTTWENSPVAVSSSVPANRVDKGAPPRKLGLSIHMREGLSDIPPEEKSRRLPDIREAARSSY